jgi:hypothetical protein
MDCIAFFCLSCTLHITTSLLCWLHLSAALHAGMERIKTCMKVVRAANKKPQNRSNTDVNHIVAETQALQLLTQHGPGVHRDLCHVVQHSSLGQLSSFRLPGEHPHGLFIYVSNQAGSLCSMRSMVPASSAAAESPSHGRIPAQECDAIPTQL